MSQLVSYPGGGTVINTALILTPVIVIFAAALQAVTGFGFGLIAVPLLLMVLPATTVVPIIMMVSLVSISFVVAKSRKHADVRVVKWLTLGSLAGIPVGARVLALADTSLIRLMASAVTLVIASYLVMRPRDSRQRSHAFTSPGAGIPFYLLIGGISGFLTTSVSMPAPPVIIAMSRDGLPKHQFRATSVMYLLVVYTISLATLFWSGAVTPEVLAHAAVLAPLAILGNMLGNRLFDRVPQPVFDRAVPLLLTLTAINNIVRR